MANKGNTRTQSFGNMQSEPNRKDDMNANRGRETQNPGRSGSKTKGNSVDIDEVEHDRESRSRSSRSRSSRSRKRSRSPFANDMRQAPDVCRDFLRNDCSRGQDCRYFHPDPEKTDRPSRGDRDLDRHPDRDRDTDRDRDLDRDTADKEPLRKKSWFTVCLDYQNGKCSRDDCRYFHVSDDDEDLFRETGEVSNHILKQAACNVHLDIPSDRMRPSCKHYLNGSCRLKNCRYRHVSREEYEDEIYKYLQDALFDIIGPPRGSLGRNVLPQHRMSAKPGLLGPSPFHSHDDRGMDNNFGKPGGLLNDFRPEIFDKREDGSRKMMDTRGNSFMRSENFVHSKDAHSREVDLNDVESLRRECIRLQDSMYDGIREKDDIISELEMKLDDFKRSFLESSGYDDHNIMAKLNRELQFEIDNLRRENSDLKDNGGRDDKDFEQLRKEARIKIAELEDDNQILCEKNDKMDTQITFFKNEIQAWKNYENFVKDQITNLQSQFFNAERELSHSWGGGPPPLASQREAWSHVKSIVSLIANSNPQNIGNQNQNNSSGNMKMKMESDGKPTSPLGDGQPGTSPGPKMGPTNSQSNTQNIRPNAPNGIRFNAPNNVRPGVPNAVRPIAPLIRPGNVRPGAPGALRPVAPGNVRPGAPSIRPGAPSIRPVAPGTVRPGAPGIRPVAPGGIRQLAPGNIRAVAPGSVRAAAPGILRTNAPNTIRQSTPGNGKSPTPSNLMSNTLNNFRPTTPGAIRLNQPGTARPISSNNIRPTQPNSIRPTALASNRPIIKTDSPSTSAEATSYDNLKNAEGYNTAGYYSSGSTNYQADASGNYSGYTPETAGNYSATAQTNFSAETGNYSSATPANYPPNASGTFASDASTYSTGTAVTYPASSTGAYPAGAPAAYGTGASGTYPTDASGNYSAGASGNYSSGASGSYSAGAGAAATYSNNGSYSTGASGTYPPVDSSGTYPPDGSYPTDASSNYASTGSYATGMYGMYGSYNDSYTSYNTDEKKNAEFISQMYNQPPPPPPSQSSPTSKEETTTGQYWRTGF